LFAPRVAQPPNLLRAQPSLLQQQGQQIRAFKYNSIKNIQMGAQSTGFMRNLPKTKSASNSSNNYAADSSNRFL